MQVRNAEQYKAKQARLSAKQERQWARDYIRGVQSPRTVSNKPNHKARAVNIVDCFTRPRVEEETSDGQSGS